MSPVNMHRVVRGAIQRINPDVPGDVYVSAGSSRHLGVLQPQFRRLPTQRLQVQAMAHDELYHASGLSFSGGMSKLYAYGALAGIVRPNGQGGDLVRLAGEWWAVQHVLEWWPGWCAVAITRQVNADTLAALLDALANSRVPDAGTP